MQAPAKFEGRAKKREREFPFSLVMFPPVPARLHLLVLQLKQSLIAQFESARTSVLHTLTFGFNSRAVTSTQGGAFDRQGYVD